MSNRGRHKKVRDEALRECSCNQLDYMMAENRAKEREIELSRDSSENLQTRFLRKLHEMYGDQRFLLIKTNGRIYDCYANKWYKDAEQAYVYITSDRITCSSNTSSATYTLQYNSSG